MYRAAALACALTATPGCGQPGVKASATAQPTESVSCWSVLSFFSNPQCVMFLSTEPFGKQLEQTRDLIELIDAPKRPPE